MESRWLEDKPVVEEVDISSSSSLSEMHDERNIESTFSWSFYTINMPLISFKVKIIEHSNTLYQNNY